MYSGRFFLFSRHATCAVYKCLCIPPSRICDTNLGWSNDRRSILFFIALFCMLSYWHNESINTRIHASVLISCAHREILGQREISKTKKMRHLTGILVGSYVVPVSFSRNKPRIVSCLGRAYCHGGGRSSNRSLSRNRQYSTKRVVRCFT